MLKLLAAAALFRLFCRWVTGFFFFVFPLVRGLWIVQESCRMGSDLGCSRL